MFPFQKTSILYLTAMISVMSCGPSNEFDNYVIFDDKKYKILKDSEIRDFIINKNVVSKSRFFSRNRRKFYENGTYIHSHEATYLGRFRIENGKLCTSEHEFCEIFVRNNNITYSFLEIPNRDFYPIEIKSYKISK